jgi:hypothetical protein
MQVTRPPTKIFLNSGLRKARQEQTLLLTPRASAVTATRPLSPALVIVAGVLAAGSEDPAFLAPVCPEPAVALRRVTVNLQVGAYPRSSRSPIP